MGVLTIYRRFFPKIVLCHTFEKMLTKLITRIAHSASIFLLIFCSTGCDRVLGLKVKHSPILSQEDFESAKGLSAPFELFLPNSVSGWELSRFTKLHFDSSRNVYMIKDIRLDLPPVDGMGPRFKLCSNDWKYQFGFGNHLSDKESSFGVGHQSVVLEIMIVEGAADMRYEISRRAAKTLEKNMMSVEFKLISMEPTPRGYMRVNVY